MKEKFNIAFLLFGLICILSFTVHGQKLEQLEEQLKTAKSENQQKLVVETYILLGDYYVNEEDKINKGQRFYRRGARRNKNNEFQDLAILYNRQYARSYVLQNNYEDAATHYEEALRIAKSNKLKNYTRNLTEEIRQFNEKRKKIELAKKELDNLKSLKDDEAIAYIEDKNSKEAQETEQFFYKINKLSRENQLQQIKIKFTENELEKKDLKIELLDQYNKAKEAEIKKNEAELALKNAEIEKRRLETQRQRNVILFFVVVSVLLIFIGLIIVRNYIKQKKLNDLLSEKNKVIKQKNQEMTDSLNYAQRIQEAILDGNVIEEDLLPAHFVFNQPKQIVSGDFFWRNKTTNGNIVWAVVDCTGHGVPGAFMSIIGVRLLNEIVIEQGVSDPGTILDKLKEGVIHTLNQKDQSNHKQDGMDMVICVWDPKTNLLEFAGANNSIYILRPDISNINHTIPKARFKTFESNLLEIKGDRSPIGYYPYFNQPFETIKIQLEKGDVIYALSDGFQDQFGGSKNKKYTTKRMKRFMSNHADHSIDQQSIIFKDELNKWKGGYEQIDDVCIVGVKV